MQIPRRRKKKKETINSISLALSLSLGTVVAASKSTPPFRTYPHNNNNNNNSFLNEKTRVHSSFRRSFEACFSTKERERESKESRAFFFSRVFYFFDSRLKCSQTDQQKNDFCLGCHNLGFSKKQREKREGVAPPK